MEMALAPWPESPVKSSVDTINVNDNIPSAAMEVCDLLFYNYITHFVKQILLLVYIFIITASYVWWLLTLLPS